jgi:hypothetical protein
MEGVKRSELKSSLGGSAAMDNFALDTLREGIGTRGPGMAAAVVN